MKKLTKNVFLLALLLTVGFINISSTSLNSWDDSVYSHPNGSPQYLCVTLWGSGNTVNTQAVFSDYNDIGRVRGFIYQKNGWDVWIELKENYWDNPEHSYNWYEFTDVNSGDILRVCAYTTIGMYEVSYIVP